LNTLASTADHAAPAVKSALRTLLIFELFAERRRALSLAEIARTLQMPKSSCLSLLSTLAERGYLQRSGADGAYHTTRRWLLQAQLASLHDAHAQHMHDCLVRLRDALGETAISAVLAGDQSTYLDVVESTELVRYSTRPGETRPLAVSASGRAQLGVLDEAARAAVLDRVYASPARPRSARRTLEKLIADERDRGWSVNLGGYRPDVISVAVGLTLDGSAHALVVAAPYARAEARADRIGRQIAREVHDLLQRLQ
jgi:DNA-binding IclR family transcriptional regulator